MGCSWASPSSGCDGQFDCAYFANNWGSCDTRGEACSLSDGSDGVRDCNEACTAPPTDDDACDERFACETFNYDDRSCESDAAECEAVDIGSSVGALYSGNTVHAQDNRYPFCSGTPPYYYYFDQPYSPDEAHRWTAPASGGYDIHAEDASFWHGLSAYRADCQTFMGCGLGYPPHLTRYLSEGDAIIIVIDAALDEWVSESGDYTINVDSLVFTEDADSSPAPATGCDEGKVWDCSETCVDIAEVDEQLANGTCNNGVDLNLDCEAFSFDRADCEYVLPTTTHDYSL
jgi:hypothetical protein